MNQAHEQDDFADEPTPEEPGKPPRGDGRNRGPVRVDDPELAAIFGRLEEQLRLKAPTPEEERILEFRETRARKIAMVKRAAADVPELLRWALWLKPAPAEAAHVDLEIAKELQACRRLLVLGPARVGKTVTLLRAMGEWVRQLGPASCEPAPRLLYVEAPELAQARTRHAGLEGAQLIERAKHATILILDELGAESMPGQTPVTDVIRYRADRTTRTWMTSGLTEEQLTKRYDDGIVARLIEAGRGRVVTLPLASKQPDRPTPASPYDGAARRAGDV